MAKVDTWKKYVLEGKCELFEESITPTYRGRSL
jgi:hypothetical protein